MQEAWEAEHKSKDGINYAGSCSLLTLDFIPSTVSAKGDGFGDQEIVLGSFRDFIPTRATNASQVLLVHAIQVQAG